MSNQIPNPRAKELIAIPQILSESGWGNMKIATKLKLVALIPVLLAVVISLALIASYRFIREAEVKDRAVHSIIGGMNDLGTFIFEYVLHHEDRPLQQFLKKHDEVSVLLAGTRFRDREQQQLLDSIQRDIELMKVSFLKLVSNHERYLSGEGNELTAEVGHRLAGRLMVWSRDVISQASYLERLLEQELTITQKRINLLIFTLIMVTTLLVTVLLTGIIRSTIQSLDALRKGAEVIGSGNLNHRIGLSTRDEIADLSRSFDRMSEQLQEVTVSKNRLQQEIEDKNKAEDALRAQSEWLRVTLDSIGDAVMSADTEGRITFLNPVASNLTGWSMEEAQGRPIRDVLRTVNEFTQQPADDIVNRVFDEGVMVNMTDHTTLIHRDGSKISIEDSAAPIKDTAGKLRGVVIVFHDVTEKRRAQETLRLSERNLRIVADFTHHWEYWRGPDNRFLYVSPSCERVTGYSREEFQKEPDLYVRIIHSDDRERVLEHLSENQFHQELCELEFRILHRDGRERWIAHACKPVLDQKGRMLGRRASNRDITARKQAEKELEQYRNELERRVRERTAELERKNRELNEFAFIASHDLQEPLRKIKTFGDMLLSSSGVTMNAQQRDYIDRLRRSASRMQALLKSLLDYYNVISKENPFDQVDLRKSVEESLLNLKVLVRKKGAQIEARDLPVVEGDPHQMTQLFQNLIGNAVKFSRTDETPRVKIYARPSERPDPGNRKFYEIYIEDNGIGFDDKYLEKIFQPFQRLQWENEFEGTGMGLTICKRIVERHGGGLTAWARPGQGSVFIVTLPEKHIKKL